VTELANQKTAKQNMEQQMQTRQDEVVTIKENIEKIKQEHGQVQQRMQELTINKNKTMGEISQLQGKIDSVGNADENAKLARLLRERLPEVGLHG